MSNARHERRCRRNSHLVTVGDHVEFLDQFIDGLEPIGLIDHLKEPLKRAGRYNFVYLCEQIPMRLVLQKNACHSIPFQLLSFDACLKSPHVHVFTLGETSLVVDASQRSVAFRG